MKMIWKWWSISRYFGDTVKEFCYLTKFGLMILLENELLDFQRMFSLQFTWYSGVVFSAETLTSKCLRKKVTSEKFSAFLHRSDGRNRNSIFVELLPRSFYDYSKESLGRTKLIKSSRDYSKKSIFPRLVRIQLVKSELTRASNIF